MPKEIRQPEQKLNSEPQPIDTTSCPNNGNTHVSGSFNKVIARILLGSLVLGLVCLFVWRLFIQPSIELYKSDGLMGIGLWILVLLIITAIIYSLIKLVGWAIDNA